MANGGTHWWDAGQEQLRRERKAVQFQAIKEALGPEIHIFPDDNDPGGTEYLYKERVILTRAENAAEVLDELGLGEENKSDDDPVAGVTTITVPQGSQWADHKTVFDHLDEKFGPGFAMPNFVVHITTTGGCPATEPRPTAQTQPQPPQADQGDANAGAGKSVIVLDSGVIKDVVKDHGWLDGVDGKAENAQQVGEVYEGHGTFIAGVLRSMAPKADVEIRRLDYKRGALLESDFADILEKAIGDAPDIINLSAGVVTRNNMPPIVLEAVCKSLLEPNAQTVLVAAAGNDMSTDPFYPASFDGVVSVGALDDAGELAGYSNRGQHVQVYAQGSDMVNAFPKRLHNYGEPPHKEGEQADFKGGMAIWSGTSFATPLVAGLIAARMTNHHETAKGAWVALRAIAHSHPDGAGRPRLFPGDEL